MSLAAKEAFKAGVQAFKNAQYNEAVAKFSDVSILQIYFLLNIH